MNNDIIKKSFDKAINGGIAGSLSMITQVSSLMWLRTINNYQYVNGSTFKNSCIKLYNNGGIPRFYRGYPFAIIQAPLSRFGDAAANTGILELTKNTNLPIAAKTGISSICSGFWRIILMPIDTIKSNYQVNGSLNKIKNKYNKNGGKILYNGSMAAFSATVVGHYPWFVTYNYLNHYYPESNSDTTLNKLGKRALIGFSSSVVSDTSSNSIRIVKIIKQTNKNNLSYKDTIRYLYHKDGILWIFRGLKTKLFTNGLNGIMFSITWKYFQDLTK